MDMVIVVAVSAPSSDDCGIAVMVECVADALDDADVRPVVRFPCVVDVAVAGMGPGMLMPGMDIGMESILAWWAATEGTDGVGARL
ncbi:hypothetical protein PG993_009870 [Apiospora rasikravindrae]|uniref:Uncharacterized protein n=1 Tax=Apiospora rasikravindrae TaxID=990691 RepID=A0ABR1SKK9_9PEZI